jgi:hypothetical protein
MASSITLCIRKLSTLKLFVAFINEIAKKLGWGDFALFLDNLILHKTKDAKHLFEKLNISEIFNVPYCPKFNRNRKLLLPTQGDIQETPSEMRDK